jgi:hypothetical protein
MTIKTSTQNWKVGETVKVGFLYLRITGIRLTPNDFKPDVYELVNNNGTQYEFTPHYGLQKVSL